jgi:hypothetical protein
MGVFQHSMLAVLALRAACDQGCGRFSGFRGGMEQSGKPGPTLRNLSPAKTLSSQGATPMPDDHHDTGAEPAAALDKTVQDHLGQKLRAAYAETEGKPAYLGDPALPPEFEDKVLAIERSAEVHDKGVEAVKEALGVTEPAHEKGVEAVRDALGVQSQGRGAGSDP